MKIEVVEVLTLNQEVARPRNAQIRALYAEDEGLSPEVLGEPTQQLGKHPADPEAARQRFRCARGSARRGRGHWAPRTHPAALLPPWAQPQFAHLL